jgi:hypothetical protein
LVNLIAVGILLNISSQIHPGARGRGQT